MSCLNLNIRRLALLMEDCQLTEESLNIQWYFPALVLIKEHGAKSITLQLETVGIDRSHCIVSNAGQ